MTELQAFLGFVIGGSILALALTTGWDLIVDLVTDRDRSGGIN